MISKNKIFIISSISLLIWIYINNLNWNYIYSFIFLSIISILIINFSLYVRKTFIYSIFIIISFLFWIFISETNIVNIEKKEDLVINYDSNIYQELKFKIIEKEKVKEYYVEYKSKIIEINWEIIDKDIYFLSTMSINYKFRPWDIIIWSWKIEQIENFNDFDYKKYLISKNIFFKSFINNQKKISEEKSYLIWKIDDLREKFIKTIKEIYTKDEWVFLSWILIWAREEIDKDLQTNFNNSWLTHLVAVSWFNITILIIFLWFLINFLPVYLRVLIISSFISCFSVLVWFNMSVLRASIMWVIWYIVSSYWRKKESLSIVLFTAVILVLFSPYSLNYDISFHLSFLAVLWILYTNNFFNKVFFFLPNFLAIKEAIVLSLSSMVFCFWIILTNFWQISIVSPLTNLLVIWTIPISMLIWFISIVLYFLSPFLWVIVWYMAWIFLKYDIFIVNIFWEKNWSVVNFDFWIYKNYFLIIYFSIILYFILYFKKTKRIL